jgi:hypothetical protein
MNNDKKKPDRDQPHSHHVTPQGDATEKSIDVSSQNTTDCPLCGAPAETIYGFDDGPQRGRLHCPSCGTVDWPPRAC